MFRAQRSVFRRFLAICAVLVSTTAGASSAQAASFTVSAANDTPTGTVTLAAGEQARVQVTAYDAVCGVESPYPCNELDGAGSSCTSFDLDDCPAPTLSAWSLVGRVAKRPWSVVGAGTAYLTGPGLVQLQYNDDTFNDNYGGFQVDVTVVPVGSLKITSINSAPATVGPGAASIPLSALPAAAPLGTDTASTLASSPLRSSPLRSSPLRSSPLRSSPLRSSALGSLSLSAIPLRSSSWDDILAGTSLDVPPAALTLDQVFALNPLPAKLQALTLADIDLARTPLRSSSLAAVLLGTVPLGKLAVPDGGWCAAVYQDDGCDLTNQTLISAEARGVYLPDLGSLALNGPGIDISGSPLASIHLSDLNLSRTALAGRTDLGAYDTIGDLVRALPLPGLTKLTLGDLLPAVIDPADLPYELAPIDALLAAGTPQPTDRISYTVTTQVLCTATKLDLEVHLPPGAKYVPGTASATVGSVRRALPDPATPAAATITFAATGALANCPAGASTYNVVASFTVDPPAHLGAPTIEVVARGTGTDQAAGAGTGTRVEDTNDPGDTPATAAALPATAIKTGYIADSSDVDLYKISAPAVGSTVTVVLSHLPADYDIAITGPPAGVASAPLRSSPLRSSPLRSSTIADDQTTGRSDQVMPALLQDLPLRSSELATLPLRSSSINRGMSTESASFTVTAADAGKDFYVQVSGYNGASSPDPYVLRTELTTPPAPPQCRAARTLSGTAARGAFPTLPLASSTKTLFIVNERRLAQLYPAASITTLHQKLAAIAARPEVGGVIVPVESDTTKPTDAAYAAWDANPCSEAAANGVASAIREVIGHVSPNLTGLKSIVLVGGDEVIPQVRVQDLTTVANESEEGGSLALGGRDTAVSRSLRDGYLLTDDAYGDFAATNATTSYIPDVALGRLVETPDEIGAQLDQYTAASGALQATTAHVAGYDFLTDGAQQILGALQTIPNIATTSQINETWTASDAAAALNRAGGGISSVNGHYDHYRALPAAAFNGLVPDLLTDTQVHPSASSLVFTAGCHAGLSISDVGVPNATAGDSRLLDWPQQMARSQAVYVANTTFGYGDSESVAYSERVLELLAQGVASQRVTAGQALLLAKQRYAAEQVQPSVYDLKSSMGLTFYGLPFFKVGSAGQEGSAILPGDASGTATVSSAAFAVDPTFERHDATDDRAYYTSDGQAPQVTQDRPIQPRTTLDVTAADGVPVHGAVIEALTASTQNWNRPVISKPVIDDSDNEPRDGFFSGVFPSSLVRTTRAGSSTGLRDQIVVSTGQYSSASQAQTFFRHIAGQTLRSRSADYDPPIIGDLGASVVNGTITFAVQTPSTDVTRAIVLMHVASSGDAWQRIELTRSGDTWQGSASVGSVAAADVSYFVQLVDTAGNVGVSTNKGPGFHPSLRPSNRTPALLLNPARPPSGFYSGPVTVTLDPRGSTGATFEVSVDGTAPTTYSAPFTVSGNGRHTVRFTGSDGSSGGTLIDIAGIVGPTVTGAISPAPSPEGFVAGPATVTWTCTDPVGIQSCPPSQSISTESGAVTVTATAPAINRAGGTTIGTAGPFAVDLTPPAGAIDSYKGLGSLGISITQLRLTRTLTGAATDGLAGIRSVSITYAPLLTPTKTTVVAATVTCSAATRRACTWAATLPLLGSWRVSALITDRAGRTTTVSGADTLSLN